MVFGKVMILKLKLNKSGKQEVETVNGYNLTHDATRKEIDTSSVGIVKREINIGKKKNPAQRRTSAHEPTTKGRAPLPASLLAALLLLKTLLNAPSHRLRQSSSNAQNL